MTDLVRLQCIIEGRSRLRVRIISPGYHQDANCSFPRNIRVPCQKYTVPMHAITFIQGTNRKYFYRIDKNFIQVENSPKPMEDPNIKLSGERTPVMHSIVRVYEDLSLDCIVCMAVEKDAVFSNCGHYCACEECATRIQKTTGKCPICRTVILTIVSRDQI